MSRGYWQWQRQPAEKGFQFAGAVSRLPAFWFSAFGFLWLDQPPLWVITPHPSPISELPWEAVSCCVWGKAASTCHEMHSSIMKEGLVCPMSTTDVFFPRDFWSHQPQGCLLLGTSNLDVNLINRVGKSSDITQTLHKGRYRWAVSKWTSLVRRKRKLKPQWETSTRSPERLRLKRLTTPNVSNALEQLELSGGPQGA